MYVSYLVAFHEEDSSPGFTDEAFLYLSEALGTVICLYMTWRIRHNRDVTCSPKLTCTGKMFRFDMYARCTIPKAAS